MNGFCFLQKTAKLCLPHRGERMSSVSARPLAHWDNHRPTMFYAFDFALEHAYFGRVNQVIRKVNRQQRGFNFFEPRSRIIIARSLKA